MNVAIYSVVIEDIGQRREAWYVRRWEDVNYPRVPVAGETMRLRDGGTWYGSDPVKVQSVQLDWDGWVHITLEETHIDMQDDIDQDEYESIGENLKQDGFEVWSEWNHSEDEKRWGEIRRNLNLGA